MQRQVRKLRKFNRAKMREPKTKNVRNKTNKFTCIKGVSTLISNMFRSVLRSTSGQDCESTENVTAKLFLSGSIQRYSDCLRLSIRSQGVSLYRCPTTYQTRQFFNNFTTDTFRHDFTTDTFRHDFTTDTFLFISHTTNVLLFKSRCNIFIGFGIIKEMPGLVGSGTPYILTYNISLLKNKNWMYWCM